MEDRSIATAKELPLVGENHSRNAASTSLWLDDAPSQLGRYRIQQEVGNGRCGRLFSARDRATGRKVLLELLSPKLAEDPAALAAVSRGAGRAVETIHPNLHPALYFGSENGHYFVVTEPPKGDTLETHLAHQRRLSPVLVAACILHAARGLSFAHAAGLTHGDIRPSSITLDRQGLVRVAGLGISPTLHRESAATPAVSDVATKQTPQAIHRSAIDSSDVTSVQEETLDVLCKQDVGALGRTLRAILADASSASEVRFFPRKLAGEELRSELLELADRMTSQDRADAISTMPEVVDQIEALLDVPAAAPQSEGEAAELQELVLQFNDALAPLIRLKLTRGLLSLAAVLSLITFLTGRWFWTAAVMTLVALSVLFSITLAGWKHDAPVYAQLRSFLWTIPWRKRWATGVLATIAAAFLYWMGFLDAFVVLMLASFGIALVMHLTFNGRAAAERTSVLQTIQGMIREQRLRGFDEILLRHFVCKHAGRHWEEVYEQLFGYQAKLEARYRWGKDAEGRRRPRFAAWRDPVVRSLAGRIETFDARSQRRTQRLIEERYAVSQGLTPTDARRRAVTQVKPAIARSIKRLDATDEATSTSWGWTFASRFDRIFGPNLRFILGLFLLSTFGVWLYQNGLVPAGEIASSVRTAVESRDPAALSALAQLSFDTSDSSPLTIPGVPSTWSAPLGNFYAGAAGLLLLISILTTRLWITIPLTLIASLAFCVQWL